MQQTIEDALGSLNREEVNDTLIKECFRPFYGQGVGVQNLLLKKADKYFKHYGKRDLKDLFLHCKNGKSDVLDEEDETLPYLQIAEKVMETFKIITLERNERILVFDNYSYKHDLKEVRKFISDHIKLYNKSHKSTFSDVFHYVMNQTLFPEDQLNFDDEIMIFPNGVYNFRKGVFGKYKNPEEKYFFYELGIEYKRGYYDCPKFKKALVQWIDEKTTTHYRKGKRVLLINDIFEGIGLCMTTKMDLKTAFLNYGPPGCGKTQFFNIISHVVGNKNLSQTSLQRLGKNEFGGEGLQFKILNYCGDLPSSSVMDTGLFKSITGGDLWLESEVKGGSKYSLILCCKFWFNANKVPRLGKWDDDATYDRFIMIPFPNQFKRLEDDTVESFWRQIVNDPNEMQGIVHEAIKGFKRLLKRGNFRNELREDTTHTWKYHSDKVYAFVHDHCKISKGRVEVTEMFEAFSDVFPGESMNNLTRGLSRMGVHRKQGRLNGKQMDFYHGIQLRRPMDVIDGKEMEEVKGLLDEF